MMTTVSIEFLGDTEQHLKGLEHDLKHIHDVDVDLVEPIDNTAPVLVAVGINKDGERALVATQKIAQTLYDFLHAGTSVANDKNIYLVTAEGDRIDIEQLSVNEIGAIITTAYEGESA